MGKFKDTLIDTECEDVAYDIVTIDMNDTYAATTSYIDTSNMSTTVSGDVGSIFIDTDDTISTAHIESLFTDWRVNPTSLNTVTVERMCEQYPALEKAWRNFKTVYDMVKQDWDGKVRAGEVDDDIPF